MSTVELLLTAFAAFSPAYLALINSVYLVLAALAWRSVTRYSHSRPQAATEAASPRH